MTFDFSFTKEEHYQFLLKSKKRNLWIWYIIYTVAYIFFAYYLIKKSFLIVSVIYLISLVLLYFVFKIYSSINARMLLRVNEIKYHSYGKYNVSINNKKIMVKVNSNKYEYKWEQIKKIKIKKDAIYLEPRKEKIMIFLPKKCIGDALFNEIRAYLKDIMAS